MGCVARFVVASSIGRITAPADMPWGTLGVNLIGAFLIGLVTAVGAFKLNLSELIRLALITGFLGGFTTFSAFSLETMSLLTRNAYGPALLYVICLFAARSL